MRYFRRFLIVVAVLAAGHLLWRAAGWIDLYTPMLKGKIAYVYDGDTIRVGKTRIRLWGIDAPELDTPEGKKARNWAVRAWEGKSVTCKRLGRTRNRIAARCALNGTDLGRQVIAAGHACEWRRFSRGYYGQRLTCERLGRR